MMIQSRLILTLFATISTFLLLETSVWAQGPGGGGGMGGGRDRRNREAKWEEELERAKNVAQKDERFILVYLCDPEEEDPPRVFDTEELRKASQNGWVFVREFLEGDNPTREEYDVNRAPTLLGLDQYGNEFGRAGRAGLTDIRGLMKKVESQVAAFIKKLKAEYSKGRVALRQKKESKVLDYFSKIVRMGKIGYSEIEKAEAWIVDYAGKELGRIRQLPTLSEQLKAGKTLIGKCAGSSVEGQILIVLSEMEADGGKVRDALRRLADGSKKLRGKQKQDVRAAREKLITFGLQKIEALVALCDVGEKEQAREGLKMIRDDYKGTDTSTRASEALKAISR
jgi:hypothetical protein